MSKFSESEKAPVCLHILGQDLVNQLHAESHELYKFVAAIAGCVKFSESEHSNRDEHAKDCADAWIDCARRLVKGGGQ